MNALHSWVVLYDADWPETMAVIGGVSRDHIRVDAVSAEDAVRTLIAQRPSLADGKFWAVPQNLLTRVEVETRYEVKEAP